MQLEQVLLNLLINARQALLGKGGSITIKAQRLDSAEIRIQVIDTDSLAVVATIGTVCVLVIGRRQPRTVAVTT